MKKLFIILLVLVMLLTLFTACGTYDETPDDTTDGTTDTPDDSTDGPDKPTAKRLSTPIVTISDDGVASWDAVEGAVSYSIAIGTDEQYDEYRQTATRFQLSDGDTVKVKAIGNGTTTTDSHYSKGKTYIAILPTAFTSISEMADVPLNKAYRVQGIVCAVGNANLLLTDNDSNFLYVYTEQPHSFKIGDEIMLAGTKCEYWNTYELTSIRESEIISTGNTVKTPFVVEGDGDYFEGVMSDFTVGAYVTVTGRVQVNGNYYNFKVEELDSALLSLAYQGEPLEDGKLYTVTGYLAFISGESNKYINIIVTEIIPVEEGDTEEICSSCGEPISSGNHADLPCSHKACEDGNHTQCDACDGYLCLGGNHTVLDCGHKVCANGEHTKCDACDEYLCLGGNHTVLDCGHKACANGEHTKCDTCDEYLCFGGNHTVLDCGHKACANGEHTKCDACDVYLCLGGNHTVLDCGHKACANGEHTKCDACDVYLCLGGNHTVLDCGHKACANGEHTKCDTCNEYLCFGGNHTVLDCGHKACANGEHTKCDVCDEYLCFGGNHTVLDCGHKVCANGEHTKCDTCDVYLCLGGNHTVLDCGHKACLDGEHTKCDFCDGYICQGDHSECRPIIIQTCPTCGEALVVGRHDMLECGHRECQGTEHEKCSKCKEYICHGGNHKALPCSHKACEDGTHIKCDTCDGYLCLGGNHAVLDCSHRACADGEHTKCDTCDEYLCRGGNHTVLDCGHKACLDGEHELCLCGDYLCIGEHGGLACMQRSTFAEIYAGENEQIFCTEGIICAKGYYEFMLTDNNGKYLHVASDVAHPYSIGDKIVIRGYRWAEGNVTYDLIPIEAQLISSNNSVRTPEKQKVNATYFINCLNGYRMGDYIEFTGTLTTEYGYYDFILSGMFTYVTMVYANPNLLDSGKNYTVTGYLLWVDSDWCWIIATSCVERIGSPDTEYCPVCNQQLLYGNHELLECGHHACEEGNHERCGYCGDFYCLGGEHGICYGCRQAICNGEEHGLCGVCGWYLCKGEHFILPCGHKVCASGSHGNCDTCGQYLCHGGAHYYLDCGHRVCSGGTHKQCPRCGEYTCNAPDHELCEHCGTYECVGEHKKCPACLAAICNQPDHKLCPICGGYVCIGDHSDCEEIGEEDGEEENENVYTAFFIYSTVHDTSEDKYYFENDDITRPLERFYIISHWNRSWNYLIKFAPHDDGTFTLTANYDTGSELLGYLPYYTFTGTYTKSGATYHLNYTAADHLSVDLMIHKGTYFPLTYSDSIEVNEEDKTFVTTELLTFILAEQYNYQQYGRKCYYCKTEIREEQMHLHITSCGTCGKQMCEGGGVGAHLYFDDTINHAKHYDVADEDKRWDVKYFNEVINPSTPPPKSETESDEEDE